MSCYIHKIQWISKIFFFEIFNQQMRIYIYFYRQGVDNVEGQSTKYLSSPSICMFLPFVLKFNRPAWPFTSWSETFDVSVVLLIRFWFQIKCHPTLWKVDLKSRINASSTTHSSSKAVGLLGELLMNLLPYSQQIAIMELELKNIPFKNMKCLHQNTWNPVNSFKEYTFAYLDHL